MTDSEDKSEKDQPESSTQDSANIQDLVGGLDFVPQWAKSNGSQSGATIHRDYENNRGPERGRGRDKRSSRRQSGRGGGRDRIDQKRGDSRGRRDSNQRGPRHKSGGAFNRREQMPRLPVEVSFIPERDRLGAVVKQLHSLKRAFPLPYVAGLFLTKPEYCLVKIESRSDGKNEPIQFYQCKKSRAIFLTQEELLDYVVRKHLEEHFERVEIDIDPPTGNFVCVGRCRRSGVLLGPPNYHGYNELVAEIHRSRFSHLPLNEYRNNIEMVREPEVIEQWKESCKTKSLYRLKTEPEAEPTLTLAQAEKLFIEKFAPQYMQSGTKVILPANMVGELSSRPLFAAIRAARTREERFPLSLMLALRPAFRRMRLHLIKAGKNETYVTSAPPKPLDAEHAIPAIKKTVEIITAHPGCTRKNLINELFPGKSVNDKEVIEGLESLAWLIDKGHIIEFFNGTYAIPGHLRDPGVVPKEMPQAHHHEEAHKTSKPTKHKSQTSETTPEVTTVESIKETSEQTVDESIDQPEVAVEAEPVSKPEPLETDPEKNLESGKSGVSTTEEQAAKNESSNQEETD